MNSRQSRRRFLTATAVVGAGAVAGCSGGESGDGSPDGEETDGDSPSGGEADGDNGSSDETVGEDDTDTGSGGDPAGSVSFDLGVIASRFGELTNFDRLVVRFDGFELRSGDGSTVSREGDGREIDLVESADSRVDLLTTNVPAGQYTEAAAYLPVVDAARTDGDDSPTFENADPMSISLGGMDDAFEMDAGGDVGFTVTLSVQRGLEADWTFSGGYRATQ